jgi:predicted enzyme related to lactoylglutathione lyase
MPPMKARYGHTNLVARDWRHLAGFYSDLFGCTPVPPERDYRGPTLEAGTGVRDSGLRGIHLRLPGHGADGPTLEIYAYDREETALPSAAKRPGWGHIAFGVDDVGAARAEVLAAGGSPVGEVVTTETADGKRVTWCYVTDPEGNIVELQAWDAQG